MGKNWLIKFISLFFLAMFILIVPGIHRINGASDRVWRGITAVYLKDGAWSVLKVAILPIPVLLLGVLLPKDGRADRGISCLAVTIGILMTLFMVFLFYLGGIP